MAVTWNAASRRDFMAAALAGTFSVPFLRFENPIAFAGDLVALGDDYYSSVAANGVTTIETVEDFDLATEDLPKTPLIIRGDTIRISGPVKNPGRDITIFARKLVCSVGAAVSTAGTPNLVVSPPAAAGTIANHAGSDSGTAADGGKGGDITIVVGEMTGALIIDTSGASGGSAQDGGNGKVGDPGMGSGRDVPEGQICKETTGLPGGQGGKAGQPGNGGNAGNIVVIVQGQIPTSINAVMNRGGPGLTATHGKPGDPGLGAPGHARQQCEWVTIP